MKVAILYCCFFDYDGVKQKIGGIETYIANLAKLVAEMGMEPIIYQYANQKFKKEINGVLVKGIPLLKINPKKRAKALFDYVSRMIDIEKDIVVFGTDAQSVKTKSKRTISIQHGIAWDLPTKYLTGYKLFHSGLFGKIYKTIVRRRFKNLYQRSYHRVCVDYNFLNWYRTYIVSKVEGKNWVIPNFCRIANREQIEKKEYQNSKIIKVIFARRFCEYRGTRLIAETAKHLLAKYNNLEFTFAGEGPDEMWLRNYFLGESRAAFIKYYPDDVVAIHLKHHIAIIPSIASEGTSLAVAEAMGAGCAVIATNIGGITNMIIDGYNGLLVTPEIKELTEALQKLLNNPVLIQKMGMRAYQVAVDSFTIDRWKAEWREVINAVK